MIELSVRREGNRATVLIACEKPRVLANATIVLVSSTGARVAETSYLTPMSYKATPPSPPNMACRLMIPTMGGDWNDSPPHADTVRSEPELEHLQLGEQDIGVRILQCYSGELFKLTRFDEEGRKVWGRGTFLGLTWNAPMLSEVPLPLCSFEYETDPGALDFYDGPPMLPYPTARNLFFLWNEFGRYSFVANWHEAVATSFLPKDAFETLRDAALQARHLLRGDPCEPEQHAQALSILDDALDDDDDTEPVDAPADS